MARRRPRRAAFQVAEASTRRRPAPVGGFGQIGREGFGGADGVQHPRAGPGFPTLADRRRQAFAGGGQPQRAEVVSAFRPRHQQVVQGGHRQKAVTASASMASRKSAWRPHSGSSTAQAPTLSGACRPCRPKEKNGRCWPAPCPRRTAPHRPGHGALELPERAMGVRAPAGRPVEPEVASTSAGLRSKPRCPHRVRRRRRSCAPPASPGRSSPRRAAARGAVGQDQVRVVALPQAFVMFGRQIRVHHEGEPLRTHRRQPVDHRFQRRRTHQRHALARRRPASRMSNSRAAVRLKACNWR